MGRDDRNAQTSLFSYTGGEFKNSHLEDEYLIHTRNESNALLKKNLLIAMSITILFFVTDYLSFSNTIYLKPTFWFRALLSLICIGGYFSIPWFPKPRHLQNFLFFNTILYVTISGVLFYYVPYPDYSIIMAGMIIVLAICVFLPQRFTLATITAIFTSAVFLYSFFMNERVSQEVMAMGTTYLFAANIFGLITYRELNKHKRQSYLNFKQEQNSRSVLEAEMNLRNVLEKKLKQQVSRDDLTGLYNRRFLYQVMKPELSRAKRNGKPISLIFFDLDHFKSINDFYGHKCGDEALKRVAKKISGSLRMEDIFARIGGEEFVILTPEMTLPQAVTLAERIRLQISEIKLSFKTKITASFGVVEANGSVKVDDVMHQADQAMYCAKKSGRNCICSILMKSKARCKTKIPLSGSAEEAKWSIRMEEGA